MSEEEETGRSSEGEEGLQDMRSEVRTDKERRRRYFIENE